jgi:type II secretory pathway pseudopilin PulG
MVVEMKVQIRNKTKAAQLAFTLIDVMVGMGVLGIVLISLFASFTFGFSQVRRFREELSATQILQEKAEAVRVYNWDQITNPAFVPTNFNSTFGDKTNFFSGTVIIKPINISNTTYSADLRQILITVTWASNQIKRTNSTRTFVSKVGLQNYLLQ